MDSWMASPPGFAAPALAYLDSVISTATHVALALVLSWVGIVLVAAASAGLPGRVGTLARHAAEALTPRAARGVLHAVMNLSVLGATVAAPASVAATPVSITAIGADRIETDHTVPAAAARPLRSGAELPAARLPALHRPGSWPQLAANAAVGLLPARHVGSSGIPELLVVAAGDSLWTIAAAHLPAGATPADVDRAWRCWYATNVAVIGPDPNLLLPGLRLVRPFECTT